MHDVFIQHAQTKQFFCRDGRWTDQIVKAQPFSTTLEAIKHCYRNNLSNAQLLVRFHERDTADVVLSVPAVEAETG